MSYNGAGTFNLYTPGNPTVTGTTISSTWANNTLSDIATGLSTAVCKDGQTTITANIPMATYKFTGLGAGSAATDSARMSQVQVGTPLLLQNVAGTNTITANLSPTLTAYATGNTFLLIPANTNTGATTLNVDTVNAKNVFSGGAACIGGELVAGIPYYVSYDGTQFNVTGVATKTGTTATTFTFDGSGGTSVSKGLVWRKDGDFVRLFVPAVAATSGTGSASLTSDTALPAAVRPASAVQYQLSATSLNNNITLTTPALISVNTSGFVVVNRDGAGTAFTNSSTCGTSTSTVISYFVGSGS